MSIFLQRPPTEAGAPGAGVVDQIEIGSPILGNTPAQAPVPTGGKDLEPSAEKPVPTGSQRLQQNGLLFAATPLDAAEPFFFEHVSPSAGRARPAGKEKNYYEIVPPTQRSVFGEDESSSGFASASASSSRHQSKSKSSPSDEGQEEKEGHRDDGRAPKDSTARTSQFVQSGGSVESPLDNAAAGTSATGTPHASDPHGHVKKSKEPPSPSALAKSRARFIARIVFKKNLQLLFNYMLAWRGLVLRLSNKRPSLGITPPKRRARAVDAGTEALQDSGDGGAETRGARMGFMSGVDGIEATSGGRVLVVPQDNPQSRGGAAPSFGAGVGKPSARQKAHFSRVLQNIGNLLKQMMQERRVTNMFHFWRSETARTRVGRAQHQAREATEKLRAAVRKLALVETDLKAKRAEMPQLCGELQEKVAMLEWSYVGEVNKLCEQHKKQLEQVESEHALNLRQSKDAVAVLQAVETRAHLLEQEVRALRSRGGVSPGGGAGALFSSGLGVDSFGGGSGAAAGTATGGGASAAAGADAGSGTGAPGGSAAAAGGAAATGLLSGSSASATSSSSTLSGATGGANAKVGTLHRSAAGGPAAGRRAPVDNKTGQPPGSTAQQPASAGLFVLGGSSGSTSRGYGKYSDDPRALCPFTQDTCPQPQLCPVHHSQMLVVVRGETTKAGGMMGGGIGSLRDMRAAGGGNGSGGGSGGPGAQGQGGGSSSSPAEPPFMDLTTGGAEYDPAGRRGEVLLFKDGSRAVESEMKDEETAFAIAAAPAGISPVQSFGGEERDPGGGASPTSRAPPGSPSRIRDDLYEKLASKNQPQSTRSKQAKPQQQKLPNVSSEHFAADAAPASNRQPFQLRSSWKRLVSPESKTAAAPRMLTTDELLGLDAEDQDLLAAHGPHPGRIQHPHTTTAQGQEDEAGQLHIRSPRSGRTGNRIVEHRSEPGHYKGLRVRDEEVDMMNIKAPRRPSSTEPVLVPLPGELGAAMRDGRQILRREQPRHGPGSLSPRWDPRVFETLRRVHAKTEHRQVDAFGEGPELDDENDFPIGPQTLYQIAFEQSRSRSVSPGGQQDSSGTPPGGDEQTGFLSSSAAASGLGPLGGSASSSSTNPNANRYPSSSSSGFVDAAVRQQILSQAAGTIAAGLISSQLTPGTTNSMGISSSSASAATTAAPKRMNKVGELRRPSDGVVDFGPMRRASYGVVDHVVSPNFQGDNREGKHAKGRNLRGESPTAGSNPNAKTTGAALAEKMRSSLFWRKNSKGDGDSPGNPGNPGPKHPALFYSEAEHNQLQHYDNHLHQSQQHNYPRQLHTDREIFTNEEGEKLFQVGHNAENDLWDFSEVRKYLRDTDRLVDEYSHLFPGLAENVEAIEASQKKESQTSGKLKTRSSGSGARGEQISRAAGRNTNMVRFPIAIPPEFERG